jgi:cellulose synthase/poly-beta-1,6-N-acetylglucosamine synthase-like glycosyltransferase
MHSAWRHFVRNDTPIMHEWLTLALTAIQFIAALGLALYALQEAALLMLFLARVNGARTPAKTDTPDLPRVMVQLPMFNERNVAARIIRAVCALDYPRDRLHIQALDDSTDDTREIVRREVEVARARGIDIALLTRDTRDGFKAGALQFGLSMMAEVASARSANIGLSSSKTAPEFVAIFDADFVPSPDFLRRVVPHFADERVGFVQARWDFLNRDQNAATRAQALMLDMHFMIEQPARAENDLLLNFNGSAGVWRRACIEDAGGWQGDTLTEDLDLSYRAELRGWRPIYLRDYGVPSELPLSISAFKMQQARWSRGSAQCVRKLFPLIARAPISPVRRLAGWQHVSGYVIHVFIMALMLVSPILALNGSLSARAAAAPIYANPATYISASPLLLMLVAHVRRGRGALSFLRDVPLAALLGIGLSWSNALNYLSGVLGSNAGQFARTPKLGDADKLNRTYHLRWDRTLIGEIACALYSAIMAALLITRGDVGGALPSVFYALGFGVTALMQIIETR